MTDITDQDRRKALAWAGGSQAIGIADAAARVILATVDAPAPTLAEDILDAAARIRDAVNPGDRDVSWADMESCADRAAQMEHDLAEACAEVERLTTVNENLRKTDNYRQFREQFLTVQKGAESNAETTDPADVKPGEAWVVECRGERRTAVKDNGIDIPWNTINADGWYLSEDNEDVTPIIRMVPAPRAITNPDELDRLAEGAIVRDKDGDAWRRTCDEWTTTADYGQIGRAHV